MNSKMACVTMMFVAGSACAAMSDEDQIKKALNDGCKAFVAGDVDGMMAPLWNDPRFVDFDLSPPRAKNFEQLKKDNAGMKAAIEGQAICEYTEINVVPLSKDVAYTMAVMHAGGQLKGGPKMDFNIRSTDVWKKIKGKWIIVHEHNSFPANPVTGQADLQSTP